MQRRKLFLAYSNLEYTDNEVRHIMLDKVLKLLNAEYAFICSVDYDNLNDSKVVSQTCLAFSNSVRQIADDNFVGKFNLDPDFIHNYSFKDTNPDIIYNKIIYQKEPYYTNDLDKDYPFGNDQSRKCPFKPNGKRLNNFANFPLIFQDKVIGSIGVANIKGEFTDEIINAVEVQNLIEECCHLEVTMHNFNRVGLLETNNENIKESYENERRRVLRNNKKLEDQLIQSQKMEAMGRLSGGMAHDFNNIISVISINTELIMNQLDKFDPLYESMNEISKSCEKAAALTQQLLVFSSQRQTVSTKMNLADNVSSMLNMLKRLIGERIKLESHVPRSLPKVKANPNQISQVIINLVVNARDALKNCKKQKIVISAKQVEIDSKWLKKHQVIQNGTRAGNAMEGKYVKLIVSDSGSGIEKDVLKNIFEPFYTTKPRGQGTGLGLSMVFGIVKQHRGWIDVLTDVNKGTTFEVYLPIYVDYVNAKSKQSSKQSSTKHQSSTQSSQSSNQSSAYRSKQHNNRHLSPTSSRSHSTQSESSDVDDLIRLISDSTSSSGSDSNYEESDYTKMQNRQDRIDNDQSIDILNYNAKQNMKSNLRNDRYYMLIVEDEIDLLKPVKNSLERQNIDLEIAASCKEARNKFYKAFKSERKFNIIFSDLGLPDGSGDQIAKEFINQQPDLLIILTSGYADYRTKWSTLDESGFLFLHKPYTIRGLMDTIRNIL